MNQDKDKVPDKSLDEVVKEMKQKEVKNKFQKPRRINQQNNNIRNKRQRIQGGNRFIRRPNFMFKRAEKGPIQEVEQKAEGNQKGRIIKIYNLSPEINEQELYNLVTQYGAVEECKIFRDAKGKSQEQATITFRDHESADDAKKDLHRNELEGRCVSVEIYKKVAQENLNNQQNEVQRNNGDNQFRQRRGFFRATQQGRQGFRNRRQGFNRNRGREGFRGRQGGFQRRRQIPW